MKKTALKTTFSALLLVIFSFGAFGIPAAKAYEDVSPLDPAFEAIDYFRDHGVLEKEKFFYPASFIKRGEFEKLAWNSAGFRAKYSKSITLPTKFKDIPANDPLAPYIQKSLSTKIIEWNEKDPNYYPNKEVAKIDALKFIFETHGIGTVKIIEKRDIPFSDVNYKSSYAPIVKTALNLGLVDAKDKKFNASKKITKAEAIQYLYKISQKETEKKSTQNIPFQIIEIRADGKISSIPGGQDGQDLINKEKFKIFVDIWKKIHHRYVYKEKIDDDKILYAAIKGMVDELNDKYTVFQKPDQANVFNESLNGEFEGIGVSIDLIDEKVTIISPLRSSPAEKAGLHPNDIISKVDGKDISGMKLEDVVRLIKGPKDTKVKLEIIREGKSINFEITREKIKMVVIDGYMKGEIAVIEIHSFNQDTNEEFTKAMEELIKKNPKGFVIDLRNNPGGYLDTALEILDHFLPKGKTLSTLSFKSSESASQTFKDGGNTPGRAEMPNATEIRYTSLGKGELSNYPMIVIQNRGSASAAEILAAALQDNGAATIIGNDSFGKGSVQELNNYIDGSQLKMSIAKWLTPKGINLTENPIKPDQYVKDDPKTDADEVMDAAVGMVK